MLREIQHFFAIYKDLEGKRTELVGWHNSAKARQVILESHARFVDANAEVAVEETIEQS
jgi:inorganic pyrophosphatase